MLKFIPLVALLSFFSLQSFGQSKKIKTDSLNWCSCNPVTTDEPTLRNLSDCEKKFFTAVVKEVAAAFEAAMKDSVIKDFIVGENTQDSVPKYISKANAKKPFNVGELGNPPVAPHITWYMDNNTKAAHDLLDENQKLVMSLKEDNDTGVTALQNKQNAKLKFWDIGERGYVTATIYTNRSVTETFYGSDKPLKTTIEGTDQAMLVPFSMNEQAREGEGVGVTLGQTVLLYGSYEPIKIIRKDQDPYYTVDIEPNIPAGQTKLKAYTIEIRLTGAKKNVDAVLKLMNHQKVRDALAKF